MANLKRFLGSSEKALLDFYYKIDPSQVVLNTAHRLLKTGNPHKVNATDVGLETAAADIAQNTLAIAGKENAGVAAGLVSSHVTAYPHADIAHGNRAALDEVSGVNTGDQTAIAGLSGTLAEFNAALTDGTFVTKEELASSSGDVSINGGYFE